MRYTIITPTILRSTLSRATRSLDVQTNGDWEHLIGVDFSEHSEKARERRPMLDAVTVDPRRKIIWGIEHPTDHGGMIRNACLDVAQGEYILYLDDDDYYMDDGVLQTLCEVTAPWAIYPIENWGIPEVRKDGIGSAMLMRKRCLNVLRWSTTGEYCIDWPWIEALAKQYGPPQIVAGRALYYYEQQLGTNQGIYK